MDFAVAPSMATNTHRRQYTLSTGKAYREMASTHHRWNQFVLRNGNLSSSEFPSNHPPPSSPQFSTDSCRDVCKIVELSSPEILGLAHPRWWMLTWYKWRGYPSKNLFMDVWLRRDQLVWCTCGGRSDRAFTNPMDFHDSRAHWVSRPGNWSKSCWLDVTLRSSFPGLGLKHQLKIQLNT